MDMIGIICKAKNIDLQNIIYIECNPDTYSKLSFYDEEMFRVDFTLQDGMPMDLKYTQLSAEEIKNIL